MPVRRLPTRLEVRLAAGTALGEIHFHRGLVHRELGNAEQAERDFDLASRQGYSITAYPEPVVRAAAPAEKPTLRT